MTRPYNPPVISPYVMQQTLSEGKREKAATLERAMQEFEKQQLRETAPEEEKTKTKRIIRLED